MPLMGEDIRSRVLRQPELLRLILEHLRGQASQSDVAHSLLVSKLWFTISLEILYANVVLDRLSAFSFFQYSDRCHWENIRTLSITFKRGTCSEPAIKNVPQEKIKPGPVIGRRELSNESVAKLSKAVQQMPRLTSLSIRRHAAGSRKAEDGFTFADTMIKNIVENLPPSCVYLEIDTAGDDHGDYTEQRHLCKALQRILPRLRSLRLKCSSPVCTWYHTIFTTASGELVKAPHLRSLVLTYLNSNALNGLFDGTYDELATVLADFAAEHPGLERGTIVSMRHRDLDFNLAMEMHGRSMSLDTFYIQDIITDVARALPTTVVSNADGLLRISRNEDIVCNMHALWHVAEGRFWHSSLQGDRLPAGCTAAERRQTRSQLLDFHPVKTFASQEYFDKNHHESCLLLTNEFVVGQRLIEPEERNDHIQLPLRYPTLPSGWRMSKGWRVVRG